MKLVDITPSRFKKPRTIRLARGYKAVITLCEDGSAKWVLYEPKSTFANAGGTVINTVAGALREAVHTADLIHKARVQWEWERR